MDGQMFAFLSVVVLVTITPGPDMALVTRHVLVSGRRTAFQAMAGIETGLVVWAALSMAGIATLLNASATAFTILKLLGSAYLIYLGLQAIWRSRQIGEAGDKAHAVGMAADTTGWQAYRQGLLSNLLNPKIGIFFTSLLPQFVPAHDPSLAKVTLLGTVFILVGVAWLSGYILALAKVGHLLQRPRFRCWLDRATGLVLVGLGLRLAADQR